MVSPLWKADAQCETGSNWRFHAGAFEGGPAFYFSTWRWWAGLVPAARRYAHAYDAPPWVQAAVAQYGLDHFGRWGCLYRDWVWARRGG